MFSREVVTLVDTIYFLSSLLLLSAVRLRVGERNTQFVVTYVAPAPVGLMNAPRHIGVTVHYQGVRKQ